MSGPRGPNDDPVLDDDARDLLAAFCAQEQLPDEMRERVWSRLENTAQPLAPAPAPAAANPLPWAIGGMVAAAAVVAAIVGLSGGTAAQRDHDRGQQAPSIAESSDTTNEAAPRERREPSPSRPSLNPTTAQPEPVSPPQAVEVEIEPEPEPEPSAPQPPRTTPKPRPKPEQPSASSSLAEETRLLEQARRAIAQEDPARAMTLLRRATKRFPKGVLLEERSALKVVALCANGQRDAGEKAAAAFMRRFPRSALRTRVSTACASD